MQGEGVSEEVLESQERHPPAAAQSPSNRYCMVLTFDGETIVRGRTYLDSALVARLFEENPIAGAA
jgi:ketosteroid isomerase-like protein